MCIDVSPGSNRVCRGREAGGFATDHLSPMAQFNQQEVHPGPPPPVKGGECSTPVMVWGPQPVPCRGPTLPRTVLLRKRSSGACLGSQTPRGGCLFRGIFPAAGETAEERLKILLLTPRTAALYPSPKRSPFYLNHEQRAPDFKISRSQPVPAKPIKYMWAPHQVEVSRGDFLKEEEDREALRLGTLDREKAQFWL